jgi:hypothetical protein
MGSNSGLTLTVPRGDFGFDINFELTDSECSAFDLTGYTLHLKMWRPGKAKDLLLNGDMTIDGAPVLGLALYTVVTGDFNIVGVYLAEVEGTLAGVQISWQSFSIEVVESPA